MKVFLKENAFGRWVIQHSLHPDLGWTGQSWGYMDEYGVAERGSAQISNCATRAEAEIYAKQQGFEVC
jgi:hypothetical protein